MPARCYIGQPNTGRGDWIACLLELDEKARPMMVSGKIHNLSDRRGFCPRSRGELNFQLLRRQR